MLSYQLINDRKQEWVVFLHGIGGSRRTFKYQIEAFALHYNLLLFDLHGHGDSMDERLSEIDKPSLEVVAKDILATLDMVGIKKAHFVGMSSGTMIQTALADLAPVLRTATAAWISLQAGNPAQELCALEQNSGLRVRQIECKLERPKSLLEEKLGEMENDDFKEKVIEKVELIKQGKRDLYF